MLLSILAKVGLVYASDKLQTPDLLVGLPSAILCLEMGVLAIVHLWAYPSKPYVLAKSNLGNRDDAQYLGGPLGVYAILDALNPWDIVKAVGRSVKWLLPGRRTEHPALGIDDDVPLKAKDSFVVREENESGAQLLERDSSYR